MTINVDVNDDRKSLIEEFRLGGGEVQRTLYCSWDDRIQLVREVLGWFDSGEYHYPDEYDTDIPDDDVPGLFADRIRITPADEDRDRAKVVITYKTLEITASGPTTPPYSQDGVWISESLESATEFITLDRKGLGFGIGENRRKLEDEDLEPPAGLNFMIDWVYTLNHLPTWDILMFEIVGKVNNASVSSRALGVTFPAETLLCMPPVTERQIDWYGNYAWKATYRFRYKNLGTFSAPIGWNHFPNVKEISPTTGIPYEHLTNDKDQDVIIFKLADFSSVIR